jgi:hypothetical protein
MTRLKMARMTAGTDTVRTDVPAVVLPYKKVAKTAARRRIAEPGRLAIAR